MKEILRKILPEKGFEILKAQVGGAWYYRFYRTAAYCKLASLRLWGSSEIGSSFYYFMLSRQFGRNHRAVIAGRIKYLNDERSNFGNYYQLRRNIHRLEKGLLMRPRRPIFALDYISETVESYSKYLSSRRAPERDSDDWFRSVLSEYFKTVGNHPRIDAIKAKHAGLIDSLVKVQADCIPYPRGDQAPSVSYEDFLSLAKRRRAVRWYEDRRVDPELVRKAVAAAAYAPSACNRQPYEFILFDEPEQAQEIARLAAGTTGFLTNIPALIAVVGDLGAYADESNRHLIYIDASLAVMSLSFALETLGLGSCCLNWADNALRDRKISARLGLPVHKRVIMLISVGYADENGLIAYSGKRALITSETKMDRISDV